MITRFSPTGNTGNLRLRDQLLYPKSEGNSLARGIQRFQTRFWWRDSRGTLLSLLEVNRTILRDKPMDPQTDGQTTSCLTQKTKPALGGGAINKTQNSE